MQSKTKDRGKLLTVMIILSVISLLFTLLAFSQPQILHTIYPQTPSWFSFYLIGGMVMGAVQLAGLWMMKRWAVYLLIFTSLLGIVIQLLFFNNGSPQNATNIILSTLVGWLIWGWAISRKWNQFD